mmetsp:Transcript_26706/g.60986  ORF Transcript_26706/g.60986 Transcript_26706/m.60986 type:complete len:573 (-) Transcript_26706:236-1954(-)
MLYASHRAGLARGCSAGLASRRLFASAGKPSESKGSEAAKAAKGAEEKAAPGKGPEASKSPHTKGGRDEKEMFKKKSNTLPILGVLAAAGAGGGYYYYTTQMDVAPAPAPVVAKPEKTKTDPAVAKAKAEAAQRKAEEDAKARQEAEEEAARQRAEAEAAEQARREEEARQAARTAAITNCTQIATQRRVAELKAAVDEAKELGIADEEVADAVHLLQAVQLLEEFPASFEDVSAAQDVPFDLFIETEQRITEGMTADQLRVHLKRRTQELAVAYKFMKLEVAKGVQSFKARLEVEMAEELEKKLAEAQHQWVEHDRKEMFTEICTEVEERKNKEVAALEESHQEALTHERQKFLLALEELDERRVYMESLLENQKQKKERAEMQMPLVNALDELTVAVTSAAPAASALAHLREAAASDAVVLPVVESCPEEDLKKLEKGLPTVSMLQDKFSAVAQQVVFRAFQPPSHSGILGHAVGYVFAGMYSLEPSTREANHRDDSALQKDLTVLSRAAHLIQSNQLVEGLQTLDSLSEPLRNTDQLNTWIADVHSALRMKQLLEVVKARCHLLLPELL